MINILVGNSQLDIMIFGRIVILLLFSTSIYKLTLTQQEMIILIPIQFEAARSLHSLAQ